MSIQPPSSFFDTSPEVQSARAKRRTGSRAKLGKRFFEDTYAAWEEIGESALARAAFHDPMGFVNMVARLMPQKLEVSTPTDGMSDERLAQLLELAEHMASLKGGNVIDATPSAVAPLLSNHEYQEAAEAAKEGGGGPFRLGSIQAENTAHALRPPPAEEPVAEHNGLEPDIAKTLPYPVGRATPLSATEAERRNLAKLHQDDIDPASLF